MKKSQILRDATGTENVLVPIYDPITISDQSSVLGMRSIGRKNRREKERKTVDRILAE